MGQYDRAVAVLDKATFVCRTSSRALPCSWAGVPKTFELYRVDVK
jgi:hypothetical protein